MNKRFYILWIAIFLLAVTFDIIVYRGAENLDCIEPPAGITAMVDVILSLLIATNYGLIVNSYRAHRSICLSIIVVQLLSFAAIFVWLFYLNIAPLIILLITILCIAVFQMIRKNAMLSGACLIWVFVVVCLLIYIPKMAYSTVW